MLLVEGITAAGPLLAALMNLCWNPRRHIPQELHVATLTAPQHPPLDLAHLPMVPALQANISSQRVTRPLPTLIVQPRSLL